MAKLLLFVLRGGVAGGIWGKSLPEAPRSLGFWGTRAHHGLSASCSAVPRHPKRKGNLADDLGRRTPIPPSLASWHSPSAPSLSTSIRLICWNCLKDLTSSYASHCGACKALQPADSKRNHFEVMGVEKRFGLDTKQLTRTFRLLQAQVHPDKFSLKSEREQQYAADHSSQINKAYRCLLHPVERALYLLELAGQPLHEGQIDMDPEFLMEIMEVNEELAEAEDKEMVQEIGQKNQRILDGLLKEADTAFSNEDISTARQVVAKIKYYNNIYEKVRDYERSHGIID
ncbi:iron-sulfur cluster co-chaperone protein HscB-like [Penaeus japonicus]|uniref:iron-sulfur cluster co-chaperone protein HscB-like n=1 Tax=Penaeus japonicus TaxID=27405 RepID=UPI001C70D26D|nr:iron-sulfur cluster co-chaperone protein HscB-like [Penaeus japonicus]